MKYKITTLVENCSYKRSLRGEHGITNIYHTVQHSFLKLSPDLVLGGFHIHNTETEKFNVITSYLKMVQPKRIGICHCTGVDKYALFYQQFGNRVFYNYTGKVIEIEE